MIIYLGRRVKDGLKLLHSLRRARNAKGAFNLRRSLLEVKTALGYYDGYHTGVREISL